MFKFKLGDWVKHIGQVAERNSLGEARFIIVGRSLTEDAVGTAFSYTVRGIVIDNRSLPIAPSERLVHFVQEELVASEPFRKQES